MAVGAAKRLYMTTAVFIATAISSFLGLQVGQSIDGVQIITNDQIKFTAQAERSLPRAKRPTPPHLRPRVEKTCLTTAKAAAGRVATSLIMPTMRGQCAKHNMEFAGNASLRMSDGHCDALFCRIIAFKPQCKVSVLRTRYYSHLNQNFGRNVVGLNVTDARLLPALQVPNHARSYRHYGCTTKKVFQNMKAAYTSVDQIEGFSDLNSDDQDKVRAAWEAEAVAAEDIPPTAVAGAEDDESGPKKKPGRPRKKQKTDDGDDDDDEEEKPKKKKAAPRRKKKADSDDDADISPSEDDAGSDYGSGKKRKRGGGSKKSPKKKGNKDDDDY
ncbi:10173_t:CDS:2 [Acaulospora colombiana]|uniref:10173_t:CDS:1 n=1 Tax=Acaulospora colombiana TaxID=27376 RepID=A0ACA9MHL4_9GLOM|nr:10173_t:CDS:2 [Acaulospora colombiana]